ncbi:MAG: hypothetical protein ACRDOO_09730 [Actinomadura sp.]
MWGKPGTFPDATAAFTGSTAKDDFDWGHQDESNGEEDPDPPAFFSWLQWLVTLLPLWLTMLIYLRRSSSELRHPLRAVTWVGLLVIPILAVVQTEGTGSSVAGVLLLFLLPVAAFLSARWASGSALLTRRDVSIAAAVALLLLGVGMLWLTSSWAERPAMIVIVPLFIGSAVGTWFGFSMLGHDRWPNFAAATVVLLGSFSISLVGLLRAPTISSVAPLLVGTGVIWVLALGMPLQKLSGARSSRWYLLMAGIGAFALLPVGGFAVASSPNAFDENVQPFAPAEADFMGNLGMSAILFILMAAALLTMRGVGAASESVNEPLARCAALVLVMAECAVMATNWWDALRVLLAMVMFTWLLPLFSTDRALRLSKVKRSVHRRLISLELRHRLMSASANDFRRAARGRFAAGELDIATFDQRQQGLERAMKSNVIRRPGWIGIQEAAFGSNCGFTSWANAVFATRASLVLSLPYVIYEEISLFDLIELDPANSDFLSSNIMDVAGIALYLLRWMAYGLIYGYFYPLLRGNNPIGKAFALWVTILPIEVIPLFDQSWALDNLVQAAVIRTAQLLAFTIGLGLVWEMRAMHAAGFPWGWLRNIRNLRSLGTPVGAVVLAAATAAATVLASSAVSALLEPSAREQPSGRSATQSPSP